MPKFPDGIKAPEAIFVDVIVGGVISQSSQNEMTELSVIFAKYSQFPPLRLPLIVDVVPDEKLPSVDMIRTGFENTGEITLFGYETFTIPISPLFSSIFQARRMRFIPIKAGTEVIEPVDAPLFPQTMTCLSFAMDPVSTIISVELLIL